MNPVEIVHSRFGPVWLEEYHGKTEHYFKTHTYVGDLLHKGYSKNGIYYYSGLTYNDTSLLLLKEITSSGHTLTNIWSWVSENLDELSGLVLWDLLSKYKNTLGSNSVSIETD